MRPDRLLLHDVLDSIQEIITTAPPTRAMFDANKLVQSHLVRHIQIIGEAAWRLSDALKQANPQVPWRIIAGMRHAIVHDYFQINWDEVYSTAVRDVPPLKAQIEAIIASLKP
jgi:uncharacterized protein with HEPN domain